MDPIVQEVIGTIESLLGHKGWREIVVPKVLRREAGALHELISDIGDQAGKADYLRGQINAYQWVLKFLRDDLKDLQAQLDEQAGVVPVGSEDRLPPI